MSGAGEGRCGVVATVRPRPCPSCPYRRDVPSGIWEESEYDKLPAYDGTTAEQAMKGALGVFHCHTAPDLICAGWAGCHDMAESLAVRFNWGKIDGEAVLSYESPVRLFASGAEAAEHGKRDIEEPSPEAGKLVGKIQRARGAR